MREIKRQRELKMRLVPVLDKEKHIVEIINLERFKTRLPIDAVSVVDCLESASHFCVGDTFSIVE